MTRQTNEPIDLFLISTPLQLINVMEAKKYLGIADKDSVVIFITYSSNFESIRRIVDPAQWRRVHYLEEDLESQRQHEANIQEKKLWKVLKKVRTDFQKINDLATEYASVENLVVGYYLGLENLHLMNKIAYNRLYLLDDGIATIEINDRRKRNVSVWKSWSLQFFLKTFFKRFFLGYRLSHPPAVSFFTIYDIEVGPGDTLIRHNYSEVRKLVKGLSQTNELIFLGQPLSEIHPELMTEEDYFSYLCKVRDHFSVDRMIYIPHKDELPTKVERVAGVSGISVLRIDMPFELFLLNRPEVPHRVAGFITSALPNCKEIFGESLEVISVRIDIAKIRNQAMMRIVEETYAYFEKIATQKFKVVSLD